MVGRWNSSWEALLSGTILVSGRVIILERFVQNIIGWTPACDYPLHVIQRLKQNSDSKLHLQHTFGLPRGEFYVDLSRCVAKSTAQLQIPSSMVHFSRNSAIQRRNDFPHLPKKRQKTSPIFGFLRRIAPKQIFRLVAEAQLREMRSQPTVPSTNTPFLPFWMLSWGAFFLSIPRVFWEFHGFQMRKKWMSMDVAIQESWMF